MFFFSACSSSGDKSSFVEYVSTFNWTVGSRHIFSLCGKCPYLPHILEIQYLCILSIHKKILSCLSSKSIYFGKRFVKFYFNFTQTNRIKLRFMAGELLLYSIFNFYTISLPNTLFISCLMVRGIERDSHLSNIEFSRILL